MSRELPEIPETPYTRHTPAKPAEPTRLERAADRIQRAWDNRPSFTELHMNVFMAALTYSGFIALGVGVADNTFDLHMADKMAAVSYEHENNMFLYEGKYLVHEVGVTAQDMEGNK